MDILVMVLVIISLLLSIIGLVLSITQATKVKELDNLLDELIDTTISDFDMKRMLVEIDQQDNEDDTE